MKWLTGALLALVFGLAMSVSMTEAHHCKGSHTCPPTLTPTPTSTPTATPTSTPTPTPTPAPTDDPPNLPPYSALESGGVRWHNYGVTPSLTLVPVDLTSEEIAALEYAASQWNATGYFRLFVGPGITPAEVPLLTYGRIPVFHDAPNLGYGGCNGPDQWCIEGNIHIGLDTVYKRHIFAHEVGHVLGLGHPDPLFPTFSIMDNWTLGGPTAVDVAALARKYWYNTGPVVIPAGDWYPTGIPIDTSLSACVYPLGTSCN